MRRAVGLVFAFAFACTANAVDPRADAGLEGTDVASGDPCVASDLDGDGFGTHPSCAIFDCDDENLGIHPGGFEACNGIDDDCDESIDEDLGEGLCGAGACRRSVPFCSNGRPVGCTPGTPTEETCNNLDDDCDGETDEDLVGDACGVGACASASVCTAGSWSACTPGTGGDESCNRIDDDCDSIVDEGFRAASIESSYTVMRGLHPQCDAGGERIGPDCNAAVHRFCASQGCTTSGFGPVENYMDAFHAGCVVADGFDVAYSELATHHPPCDGSGERIGPNCNAAMHRYCASRGYASGFGPTEQSQGSALVQCLAAGEATVINTSYTELSTHHGGCTIDSRIGPDCNAAIHRYCRSAGHVSGFGPVENSGDVAVVTCVDP